MPELEKQIREIDNLVYQLQVKHNLNTPKGSNIERVESAEITIILKNKGVTNDVLRLLYKRVHSIDKLLLKYKQQAEQKDEVLNEIYKIAQEN